LMVAGLGVSSVSMIMLAIWGGGQQQTSLYLLASAKKNPVPARERGKMRTAVRFGLSPIA